MAPAPPKPWERGAGASAAATHAPAPSPSQPMTTSSTPVPAATTTAASAPAVPARPASLTTGTTGALGTTGYGATGYGNGYGTGYGGMGTAGGMGGYGGYNSYRSGYGSGLGGYSSYSSPYSRFGGGYGMGGYGMGGYGGYGGYGASPYGMQPGMGMPGEMGLTQRMEAGTAATFQIIESVVGAFGGFAQMLESTFMATHSSFFAMIGVAEQFGHLRNYLGQILSIFSLIRWAKALVAKLTGRPLPVDLSPAEFSNFTPGAPGGSRDGQPKPSKRTIIIFFLTVIGIPWLMSKLVKLVARQQEEQARLAQIGPDGRPLPAAQQQPGALPAGPNGEAIDPASLTFVRAVHPFQTSDPVELALQPNDIVAVLSRTDHATGQESAWWRGRTRDGRIGFFPANHVAEIAPTPKSVDAAPAKAPASTETQKA